MHSLFSDFLPALGVEFGLFGELFFGHPNRPV